MKEDAKVTQQIWNLKRTARYTIFVYFLGTASLKPHGEPKCSGLSVIRNTVI
jgi:hypothetical protein